jgi:hypothetical protein
MSRFRILSFDHGIFSFKDFKFSSNVEKSAPIFILLTNPKNLQFKASFSREPLDKMKQSTHIRFLVFSKNKITSAKVYIDNIFMGEAQPIQNTNGNSLLFALKWNPLFYAKGLHHIKIMVQVKLNTKC